MGLENCPRAEVLGEQGSLFDGQIKYRLLQGAPLMLNEVVFLHNLSKTLLVADAYYTGHCCTHYGTKKVRILLFTTSAIGLQITYVHFFVYTFFRKKDLPLRSLKISRREKVPHQMHLPESGLK